MTLACRLCDCSAAPQGETSLLIEEPSRSIVPGGIGWLEASSRRVPALLTVQIHRNN